MMMRILRKVLSFFRPKLRRSHRSRRSINPAAVATTPPAQEVAVAAIAMAQQAPITERLPSSDPEARAARFLALADHMKAALASALRPGETGPPRVRPRLRGRWKKDLPLLAEKCADLIGIDLELFPGLSIGPQDLHEQVAEVRELEILVKVVQVTLKQFQDLLAARKDELCKNTQAIVEQVESLSAAPLLSTQQKSRVATLAGPILMHLRERNGKVQEVRQHRRHIKEMIEAETGEVQQEMDRVLKENHILRGGR